ncbi:MAG: STAS domain-containing protein [Planctomycetia bacterium]|jgi:anti-sigma B factor antagonist
MSVVQKPIENVSVIQPPTTTLDTRNVNEFRESIQEFLSEKKCLILDMSNVTFVDSSGLGVLLSALKQTSSVGGSLRLACLQDEVLNLFRLVRMNRVFEIFETVDEALADQEGN